MLNYSYLSWLGVGTEIFKMLSFGAFLGGARRQVMVTPVVCRNRGRRFSWRVVSGFQGEWRRFDAVLKLKKVPCASDETLPVFSTLDKTGVCR